MRLQFILLCALRLSAGIISYNSALSRSVGLAWLILLVFIATWVFASLAGQNYWQMISALHFPADCMPYSRAGGLLAGRETL